MRHISERKYHLHHNPEHVQQPYRKKALAIRYYNNRLISLILTQMENLKKLG